MNQSESKINSKCASIGRLSNGIDLTHSVENEYLYLKLLSFFNLPVAKARMAQFGYGMPRNSLSEEY